MHICMKWQSVDFNWNHARAFLATVEEGSLSAAAVALGQTQPTIGRQISALEAELEVTLFERNGRALMLTQTGRDLVESIRAMREAANRASLAASGHSRAVAGKVRLTATDMMSAYVLPFFIARVRDTAPMVEIDVVAANDIRDLQWREADIAVRHVRPEQPELIARLVGEESAHFYASSGYLDRFGRPQDLEEMARHDFVGMGDTARMIGFCADLGLKLAPENFRASSDSGLVAWEFARRSLGIIAMADDVASRHPEMEQVLPASLSVRFPVWLAVHRELATSRRIRLVYDLLVEFFKDRPTR